MGPNNLFDNPYGCIFLNIRDIKKNTQLIVDSDRLLYHTKMGSLKEYWMNENKQ